jgi:hypothetical protein
MRLNRTALVLLAAPQLLLVGGCNAQENGSGRASPDGSDIAQTGLYNGHDTHGEGAGSVAERSQNAQSAK